MYIYCYLKGKVKIYEYMFKAQKFVMVCKQFYIVILDLDTDKVLSILYIMVPSMQTYIQKCKIKPPLPEKAIPTMFDCTLLPFFDPFS